MPKISQMPASAGTDPDALIPVVEGGANKKTSAGTFRLSAPPIVPLTGASNALALAHLRKFLTISHTASAALVVPLNATLAIPIGSEFEGASIGAGLITVTPESGSVIIHSETGDLSVAQYSNFILRKIGADEWLLKGKFVVSGGGYRRLDNTYSPLARYDFNGSLDDASGNGRTLAVQSGAEKYSDIKPGFRCFNADGTTRLWHNTAVADLRLTGAMSAVFLYAFFAAPGSYSPVFSHTGASGSESSADNTLYELDFISGHDMAWVQENGSGANTDTASLLFTPSKLVYPTTAGLPCVLGVTRSATGVVQLYVNGRTYGAATATRTASDGGASGRLYLFGSSSGFGNACSCWGMALYGSALTAAEMADIYNRALGQPYYGETFAP